MSSKSSHRKRKPAPPQPKKRKRTIQHPKRLMILLGVCAVLLIVGGIWWYYHPIYPSVRNGVLVSAGDQWLITNLGDTNRPVYRKVGEIVQMPEGYTLSETSSSLWDDYVPLYLFTPSSEEGAIQQCYVQVAKGAAAEVAESFANSAGLLGEVTYTSPMVSETINGRNAYLRLIEYTASSTDDAGNETTSYYQSGVLYIESTMDERSVVVNAINSYASPEERADRDQILDDMRSVASCVLMDEHP